MEWVSSNGKWKVHELSKGEQVSIVTVRDLVRNRRDRVFVDHIKKGVTVVRGSLSKITYDEYTSNFKLPNYVKKGISELIDADKPRVQCITIEIVEK
ncbi:hypothetical protein MG295_00212 [Bacillus phage vB_BcgM]|nr:hypothetical protein MG295_00212 [Bacillus phage vB_BcgM]